MVNSMSGYEASVVTVTLGDKLSGTIAQAVEVDVEGSAPTKGQAATTAASQPAKEAPKPT